MLFAPRAATKPMTEFLRRLGISLEAGIDLRKALANEANRAIGPMRSRIVVMNDAVSQGASLTEALRQTGKYFPELVRELVSVGEQTGHLPEVLRQLVAHYEGQIALRRTFVSTITWPMVQFSVAALVIGFLIWMSGVITHATGNPTDLLGFGLTGTVGALIYFVFLGVLSLGGFLIYRAIAEGKLWAAPIQRVALKVPMLGGAIQTLSLARFAWTLQLTMAAAIDVRKALSLALASAHNVEYTDREPFILDMVTRGQSIHETLAAARIFPIEFIQAVEVGENSGRLAETMSIVANQQLEAAGRAFAVLTRIAGYLVWLAVAVIIIALIFRLFGAYVNTINRALQMR